MTLQDYADHRKRHFKYKAIHEGGTLCKEELNKVVTYLTINSHLMGESLWSNLPKTRPEKVRSDPDFDAYWSTFKGKRKVQEDEDEDEDEEDEDEEEGDDRSSISSRNSNSD